MDREGDPGWGKERVSALRIRGVNFQAGGKEYSYSLQEKE